ncbi:MAG: hypothetical protein E7620_06980 [Ruminococcaceae bacterium]|nr:hypothetical protein [Oscillospiraceae bacterium]
MDERKKELTELLENALSDAASEIANEIIDSVSNDLVDAVSNAVADCLTGMEYHLKDGTVVIPRPRMKLMNPDKTKLILCYGGLRIGKGRLNGGEAWNLWVQTAVSSWDAIASYPDRESAAKAMRAVTEAMEQKISLFEL